ncbi:Fructosamine/Ketosamine-3-kinase [Aspergillus karnatakaensis]|uniref:Fructosamine/Ketosamine-3-kinase n=1 Tax=Aspergillus karnatakaensis TaxID=1810916 RepID=UPI003CCDFB74
MLNNEIPTAKEFVTVIATIHRASAGHSPNTLKPYGFHVPTHLAHIPNDNSWQATWEGFFAQAMKRMFDVEESVHGKEERLSRLKIELFGMVIPRLSRPLETRGRVVTPCLVHSDLWLGNVKVDAETRAVVVLDSCAFWGHNEADLGSWRAERYNLGREYLAEYVAVMGVSEPRGDWEDRNALYAIRYDLLVSALRAKDLRFREMYEGYSASGDYI